MSAPAVAALGAEASWVWRLSWRTEPAGRVLADRHYNRQNPESCQFVPPGRCLVLVGADEQAVWVTSWPYPDYVQHAWPGAWVNSLFRREGGPLASEMIRHAVAITRWRWPAVPPEGLVTFIDPTKVRPKRDPGYCYLQAGFRPVGSTKGGLVALHMAPEDMPAPRAPEPQPGRLFAL